MSEIETGKRGRFQFSLRALMLTVTLSAVALSCVLMVGPQVALEVACGILRSSGFLLLIIYLILSEPTGKPSGRNRGARTQRDRGNAEDPE